MSSGVVYEFADGSGVWLVSDGMLDAAANKDLAKACKVEHRRRLRLGLPGNGVMRLRRNDEPLANFSNTAELMLEASVKANDAGRVKTYFFHRDDGMIKIGKTTNVSNRKHSLETLFGKKLQCIGIIPRDVEHRLHKHFRRFRGMGEWFKATPEMIEEVHRLIAAARTLTVNGAWAAQLLGIEK